LWQESATTFCSWSSVRVISTRLPVTGKYQSYSYIIITRTLEVSRGKFQSTNVFLLHSFICSVRHLSERRSYTYHPKRLTYAEIEIGSSVVIHHGRSRDVIVWSLDCSIWQWTPHPSSLNYRTMAIPPAICILATCDQYWLFKLMSSSFYLLEV
jgi:hypothetical protein